MGTKKQTATEWLYEQLTSTWFDKTSGRDILEQAKAMEKEQMIDAFGVGCQVESTRLIGYQGMAEQYYNETYGGNK
jgi:hypothetical protein